jgi:P27 family predicted phage terminase small subunit
MPGPAKKPTKLLQLEGNAGKRPLPANEPQPERDARVLVCPAFLKGVARLEWNRVAPELYRLKLLTKVDHAALESYCSWYQTAVEADQEIARLRKLHREYRRSKKKDERATRPSNGMVMYTTNGNVIMEPMLSARKQAWEMVKVFAAEFGMTPASRARIAGGGAKKADTGKSAMQRFMDAKQEISN